MSAFEYCLVHFIESDDVEVAPSNWIEKNICYWPPYKVQKVIKAVRQAETPDKKSWEKFMVRVLHKCKDYSTARNKLKKAEDTSDLNTEQEENIGKGKRKHQPYKRINQVSSSEDESIIDEWDNIPPLPPVPNQSLSMRSPSTSSSTRDDPHRNQLSYSESTSGNQISNNDSGEKEFRHQVLRSLNVIKARQEQQGQLLDAILQHLVSHRQHQHNEDETEDVTFPSELLPLKTDGDLEEMEKLLENPPFKKKFAIKLSSIGGNNLAEVCRRIMKYIITDQLAENFSWFGAKGKQSFSNLKLKDVIQEAVKRNDRIKGTDKDIQMAIMGWLRHAKERNENQKKKI